MNNPDFRRFWSGLGKAGVIRGAYHFFYAQDRGVDQAQHFNQMTSLMGEQVLPPIVDVEMRGVKGHSVEQVQRELDAFLFQAEQLFGRRPIIYTNRVTAQKYLQDEKYAKYPLWFAEYMVSSPRIPPPWRSCIIWQKEGNVPVAGGKVDLDEARISKQDLLDLCKEKLTTVP